MKCYFGKNVGIAAHYTAMSTVVGYIFIMHDDFVSLYLLEHSTNNVLKGTKQCIQGRLNDSRIAMYHCKKLGLHAIHGPMLVTALVQDNLQLDYNLD